MKSHACTDCKHYMPGLGWVRGRCNATATMHNLVSFPFKKTTCEMFSSWDDQEDDNEGGDE